MSPSRRLTSFVVATVLLVGTAADVCAQAERDPRAARPYRGLFGRDDPPDENGQILDLTLSLLGGYDDDITAKQGTGLGNSSTQASSKYFGGSSQLRYRRRVLGKLDLEAQGRTNTNLYTDIDNLVATGGNAGVGLNWTIDSRTSLRLSQQALYSPFYSYSAFPAPGPETPLVPESPTFDTRVTKDENLTLGSLLSFTRKLSSRSSFQASANYSYLDFRNDSDDQRGGEHYGGRAMFSYSLTSRAHARVGYGYRTGDYAATGSDAIGSHTIDVGIDYARALSFSRKTQFSFSTGSVIYSDLTGTHYRLIGNAQLGHQLGRTWQLGAAYSRSLQYVNGFQDPFFTDAVAGGLSGYWGRRVLMRTDVGMNWGQLGVSTNDADNRDTRTSYVTPSLQYALTEFLALQASYFYYFYTFDEGAVPLPEGLEPERTRQGVRVSLSWWLPLVR